MRVRLAWMPTSSPLSPFIAGLISGRGGIASMNRIDRGDTKPKYWYMEETDLTNDAEGSLEVITRKWKGSRLETEGQLLSPDAKPCCRSLCTATKMKYGGILKWFGIESRILPSELATFRYDLTSFLDLS